jgi:hypothetical protein
MENEIKCPQCSWQPTKYNEWQCSCRHIWNTFNTGGQCPKCTKIWEDTCCPKCYRWSPHIDWYGFDKLLKFELDKISNTILK